MCFDTLIGIRNSCEDYVPKSGLYIDDYADISLTLCDQLITEDFATGYDLFKKKRDAAGELMQADIIASLQSYFKADTIIAGSKMGFVREGPVQPIETGYYLGAAFRQEGGSFTSLFISNIIASADVDQAIDIKVVDLLTNKVIDTISGNTNELINVSKEYSSNRNQLYLAFVTDSTFQAQPTVLKDGYCDSCRGRNPEIMQDRLTYTQGIKAVISGDTLTSRDSSGFTGGLQINYAVNCDRKAWICSNSRMFAMAHIFKTASEIINYGMLVSVNERANTSVTINAEVLKQRFDYYNSQYQNQLSTILNNMKMPTDSNCFQCKQNVKWSSIIP